MCVFLLAAGLSLLKTEGSQGARIGPVVLFVYLFTIAYSMGEGPVAFQYSAEVFPTIQREQGMAWVVCINNTFGMSPSGVVVGAEQSRSDILNSWYPRSDLPANADRHDPYRSL